MLAELTSVAGTDSLVEVDRRPLDPDVLVGYVIEATVDQLFLQLVDDSYRLNGYTVVRCDDIDRYRISGPKDALIRHVLRRRYPEGFPTSPDVRIGLPGQNGFPASIHGAFPLVTIHRERLSPGTCLVGVVERMGPKTLTLHCIDPEGEWDELRRIRYADITRIDFGGAYEEALWIYSADRGTLPEAVRTV